MAYYNPLTAVAQVFVWTTDSSKSRMKVKVTLEMAGSDVHAAGTHPMANRLEALWTSQTHIPVGIAPEPYAC